MFFRVEGLVGGCFLGLEGWLGGVARLDKCAGRGAAAPLPFLNSSCFHLFHLFADQRHRQRHHRQNHHQQQIIVTILILLILIAIFVRRPVWISFIVVPTPPWRPLNADLVLSGRRLAFFGSKLDNWLEHLALHHQHQTTYFRLLQSKPLLKHQQH